MNRLELVQRVRSLTRDLTSSIFREVDVVNYINESIDRIKQVLPELESMEYLNVNESVPVLLPSPYHHLLSVYSASRCFGQDERHYQSSTLMNEFELKLDELKQKIENGDVVITDANGNTVERTNATDHVEDVYFTKRYSEEW